MAAAAPIAMGAGLLGSVVSTTSNVAAADAAAKNYAREAESVQQQAAYEEQQTRRTNKLLMGEANATAAGSGLALSSGSPLLLELDRAKQAEIQAQNIRRSGVVAAQGLQYQSRMARRAIPGIIAGGALNGASILTSFMGSPAAKGPGFGAAV